VSLSGVCVVCRVFCTMSELYRYRNARCNNVNYVITSCATLMVNTHVEIHMFKFLSHYSVVYITENIVLRLHC
jgi:hypothetical protein